MIGRNSKRRTRVSAVVALSMAGLMSVGLVGATSTVAGANKNNSSSGIWNYKNKLNANTNGWCPITTPPNAPCDGGVNNYGTIDIVSPTYSNNGGYAASVAAPAGVKKYARTSGAQDGGIPTITGCSVPGNENCSGPYTKFGSVVHHTIFPKLGFTTSIKMYIDAAWAGSNPGQVIDWDVSLRDSTGGFLQDNVFNLCSTSNGGGGFYISSSYNAGACSTGPTELTTSGWYTFNLTFTPLSGQVWDTYTVLNSAAVPVFNQVVNTGNAVATTGGPDYGWLPDEDALGLPISQVSLTVN